MRSVPDAPPSELMYVITRRQPWLRCSPWASRPWRPGPGRRPARLIGPTIARQAGNRLARQPDVPIEQMLRALPGENWRRSIPVGAVLATAILAGMSRVAYIDPLNGHAIHDGLTETGCAAGLGRTRIDAWDDFSPGRWLRLAEAQPATEPLPAVGHRSFWHWDTDGGVWRPSETRTAYRPTWTGTQPCPVSGIMETSSPSTLTGTSSTTYWTTSAAKRGAK